MEETTRPSRSRPEASASASVTAAVPDSATPLFTTTTVGAGAEVGCTVSVAFSIQRVKLYHYRQASLPYRKREGPGGGPALEKNWKVVTSNNCR